MTTKKLKTNDSSTTTVKAEDLTKKILAKITFGSFVRGIRESDEITQTELARRLGTSRQYINAIETERQEVSIETAAKIGLALGYGAESFLEVLIRTQLAKAGLKLQVQLKKAI